MSNTSSPKMTMKKEFQDQQIVEFYTKHLDDMIRKHNKVLQVRFDLHYPQDDSGVEKNKVIRDFSENISRDLKRNNPLPEKGKQRSSGKKSSKHQVDPRLVWVREQHEQSHHQHHHQHFHCLTLVNGNAKKNERDIFKRVERQWANALGLTEAKWLVDFCYRNDRPAVTIDRNSPDLAAQYQAAKKQATYLAKNWGKDKRPKGCWKVGGSRLK